MYPMMYGGRRMMKYENAALAAQNALGEQQRLNSPTWSSDFQHSFDPTYDPNAAERNHESDMQNGQQLEEQWRMGEENKGQLARIGATETGATERAKLSEAAAADRSREGINAENWRLMYGKTTPQATNDKFGTLALKNYNDMGQVIGETPYTWNQQTGEPLALKENNQIPSGDWLKAYDAKNPAHIQELYQHYSQMSPDQQAQFAQSLKPYPDLAIALHNHHQNQVGLNRPGQVSAQSANPTTLANVGQSKTESFMGPPVPEGYVGYSPFGNEYHTDARASKLAAIHAPSVDPFASTPGVFSGSMPAAPTYDERLKDFGGEMSTRFRRAGLPAATNASTNATPLSAIGNPSPTNIMGKLQSLEAPHP
jgi:hypothetical protein